MAVLGNLNGQSPDEIGALLVKLVHGQTVKLVSERKEISVPPEVLQAYVGTYELNPGLDYYVTLDGKQLMGSWAISRASLSSPRHRPFSF